MKTETPLACNMNVFTHEQREAHIQATRTLMNKLESIREVQNGYEFVFPGESELISGIAEFIANERLCCPFLDFGLKIEANSPSLVLSLTGPTGTQEFLSVEFEEAFQ